MAFTTEALKTANAAPQGRRASAPSPLHPADGMLKSRTDRRPAGIP
jgi:hypothetical protein